MVAQLPTVWRRRVGDGGSHWASPVHAGGKIYFCSDEGDVAVIAATREFQVLAENHLADGIMASPAITGDALVLRSRSHLYCFAEGATGGVGRVIGKRRKAAGGSAGELNDATARFLMDIAADLEARVARGEMTKAQAEAKFRAAIADKVKKR